MIYYCLAGTSYDIISIIFWNELEIRFYLLLKPRLQTN